jgi:hypothetical protein
MSELPAGEFDTCLVVDFGAQYAQLIARRVREAHVYSEIVPHSITAAEVRERAPVALILSGGPKSVHVEGAPLLDPEIYTSASRSSACATAPSSSPSSWAARSRGAGRASTAARPCRSRGAPPVGCWWISPTSRPCG